MPLLSAEPAAGGFEEGQERELLVEESPLAAEPHSRLAGRKWLLALGATAACAGLAFAMYGSSHAAESPALPPSATQQVVQLRQTRHKESGRSQHDNHWKRPDCDDCSEAWDDDKVKRLCKGRAPAGERRLGEDPVEGLDLWDSVELPRELIGLDDMDEISRIDYDGKGNILYYGSADLNDDVIAARSAVISVHGQQRNAQDYFCTLAKLVDTSPMVNQDTVMIVPKFIQKEDKPRKHDCFWNGSFPYGFWPAGANTDPDSPCDVSSYAVFDYLIGILSDKDKFPFLDTIKFVGFSAGGQTIHRYTLVGALKPPQMSSTHDAKKGRGIRPDIKMSYIIGNPGVYTYINDYRWIYDCDAKDCGPFTYAQYHPQLGRRNWNSQTGFHTLDYESANNQRPFLCQDSKFETWAYSIDWKHINQMVPYLRDHPDLERAVFDWYPERSVIHLIGQNDTCTHELLPFCYSSCWARKRKDLSYCFANTYDTECPAMLQGPTRYHRATGFFKHLEHVFGKKVHSLFLIPDAGHQAELEMLKALDFFIKKEINKYLIAGKPL